MASSTLYAPTIASIMPAFTGQKCKIYYELSKFNSSEDVKSIQAVITRQGSAKNILQSSTSQNPNPLNGEFKYADAGIILDIPISASYYDSSIGKYFFYVNGLMLDCVEGQNTGWIPDWIYKIQIRLCGCDNYSEEASSVGQQTWLNQNAAFFSEWSTVCVTKPIPQPIIDISNIPNFELDTEDSGILSSSFLRFIGNFGFANNATSSEYLYSYTISLKKNGKVLEQYHRDSVIGNQIIESFETLLENEETYIIEYTYCTNNLYEDTKILTITVDDEQEYDNVFLLTEENWIGRKTQGETVVTDWTYNLIDNTEKLTCARGTYNDDNEGRVGIRIVSPASSLTSTNYKILRASYEDNFTKWKEIKRIYINNISKIDKDSNFVIFDRTAESGKIYKYGIQSYNPSAEGQMATGKLRVMPKIILRKFDYSFLLNADKQLCLMFNNTISNLKNNTAESSQNSIGGKFPIFSNNSKMNYKSFGLNGLISFQMDENKLFLSREEKYRDLSQEVLDIISTRYDLYYDFTFEKDFRDAVMAFLEDREPKLFKSATEGNMIIKIMKPTYTPEKTVGRMIYSFSAEAIEYDEDTLENYLKYNFYNLTPIEESEEG